MKPITRGEYVLATKWSDGDPRDNWAIGFYDKSERGRHFVVDITGQQFRGNGFRRVRRITPLIGKWLLDNSRDIELSGKSVWGIVRCLARANLTVK